MEIKKVRGRPKKGIDKASCEKEALRYIYNILYMFDDAGIIPKRLKELGASTKEIEVITLQRAIHQILEKEISEIYKKQLKVLDSFSDLERLSLHWLTNRYISFKLLRARSGYGDELEKMLYITKSEPDFDTLREIVWQRPHVQFSRKGGPKPYYEDYLHLAIIDSYFKKHFAENINKMFNFIYSPEMKNFLLSVKIFVPTEDAFRVQIQKIRNGHEKTANGGNIDQDSHLMYFPIMVGALSDYINIYTPAIHTFSESPIISKEYLILNSLDREMREKVRHKLLMK